MKHTLVPGLLSVTGYKDVEVIIEELPMAEYEKFYKYWQVAMQSVSDSTLDFTTAYCSNQAFRANVLRALEVAGIENPDTFLTPRSMQQLLMTFEGDAGLLFQLHGETPKMAETPVKLPKTKKPTFQKTRISSIWQGTLRRLSSAQKTLFNGGLFLVF